MMLYGALILILAGWITSLLKRCYRSMSTGHWRPTLRLVLTWLKQVIYIQFCLIVYGSNGMRIRFRSHSNYSIFGDFITRDQPWLISLISLTSVLILPHLPIL